MGAFYCSKTRKYGGVGVFIHDKITYSIKDLNKYCNEFDLEVCALKLKTSTEVFYILFICRPPTSNFLNFLSLRINSITIILKQFQFNYLR